MNEKKVSETYAEAIECREVHLYSLIELLVLERKSLKFDSPTSDLEAIVNHPKRNILGVLLIDYLKRKDRLRFYE
jgi:hypothetical protein